MDKNEFINYIKYFLPFDCNIFIKNKNNHLIQVNKKLFTTNIFIHPVFLKSDKNLIQDIIKFILKKNDKDNKEIKNKIKIFYEKNKSIKKIKLVTEYKFKDIKYMYNEIINKLKNDFNNVNFNELKLTWGKKSKKRRVSIRFGSYDKKNKLIRIHPVLDDELIPDYFIKSIIYHEIAHFIIYSLNPKTNPHSKDFHQLLKKIDFDYYKSHQWEKNNKKIFFNKFFVI